MRRIAFLVTLSVLSLNVSLSLAQGPGGGGTGGGGFGGGTGGGGGGAGAGGLSGGGSQGGGLSSGGSLGLGGNTTGGTGILGGGGNTMGAGGARGLGGARGGTTSFSVSPTNFLQPTYGNVLYPSRPNSQNLSITAGTGFGQPSFGNITATTTASNMRGGATATTFANQGATGARIHHVAELKFPVKQVVASELIAELQGIIARSSQIKQPGAIQVSMEGGVVVLRGKAATDDERRLIEGMMRLTPGVRQVKNELEANQP